MAFESATDSDWKVWGDKDPYYGVVSAPQFHRENLNEQTLREFFLSGEKHVNHVLAVLRGHLRPGFTPSRVLDFGCGVGRLVIPFAGCSEQVTGVDVSPAMLKEAAQNASRQGIGNVRFLLSDQLDSIASERFDLIHSFIVFQHIPPKRGEEILRHLLRSLEPKGLGAIHLTFSKNASGLRRFASRVNQRSRTVHGLLNLVERRPFSQPVMQMNPYSLNRVFNLLASEGCGSIYSEFSQHGDNRGLMLYFEKIQPPML
jgi:SAM-dependent methyltransferase